MWYSDFFPIIEGQFKHNKKFENWAEYWAIFRYFSALGVHRYKICGKYPETIDPETILDSLFWRDSFAIFRDPAGNWYSLPAQPSGLLTMCGYPAEAIATAYNGKTYNIKCITPTDPPEAGNGMYIMAAKTPAPLVMYAAKYAERAADSMRAIDVLRQKSKSPYIIYAREEMRKTVERFLNQIAENDTAIISTGVFDPTKSSVALTPVSPESIKAMKDLVQWYTDQFLTIAGINANPQSDKRERLLVDEINANNDQAALWVKSNCDFINKQLKKLEEISNGEIIMEVQPNVPNVQRNYDIGEMDNDGRDDDPRNDTTDPDGLVRTS